MSKNVIDEELNFDDIVDESVTDEELDEEILAEEVEEEIEEEKNPKKKGFKPSALLPDEYLSRKSEMDALYLIRVGLTKLQNIPDRYRTVEVCTEACRIDPAQAAFVPAGIVAELPSDIQKMCEIAKSEERDKNGRNARDDRKPANRKRQGADIH